MPPLNSLPPTLNISIYFEELLKVLAAHTLEELLKVLGTHH